MKTTTTSNGQSLVDVALQELGSVAALFDLADANGRAITDLLTPGLALDVSDSAAAVPATAAYYAAKTYRVNVGQTPPPVEPERKRDFNPIDFSPEDFS